MRALPSIFRSRPLLWVPFVLVGVGFVVALILYGLPPDIQSLAVLYLQFAFAPQGLFIYFVAGYLAPRAAYLVGGILGVLDGVLYAIAVVLTLPPDVSVAPGDLLSTGVAYVVQATVLGVLAGAFGAWYRDLLRGIQDRSKQKRADKEVDERARRREQRQESRKLAKQRPTS